MVELSRRNFVKAVGVGAGVSCVGLGREPLSAHAAAQAARSGAPWSQQEPVAGVERAGEDPLAQETVVVAENLEPVIPHPEQQEEARRKLAALERAAGKRPNILIFLMDNVGFGDPGIYGGGLLVGAPTPNMDRLGREGLQLLSTYSQPSCTPSRCTLLTGRLPMRHGQLRPGFAGEPGGLGDEVTVARILSESGYMTQAIGKWHCGENEESQPQNVGFDDFYGFLGWSGLYTDWRDPEFAPDFALSPERQALVASTPFNNHIVHATKGQEVENLEEITTEVSAELDDKFATYSEEFIRKMARSDKPFFLYHCTRGAHWKNYPNPRFRGKSPARYPFKDSIVEMDDVLGRLVRTLDETGQLENTLIFVTSDNGPAIEPWPDAGYTPFRGGIGGTWEGSVRVPGIVYWKDMIAPGRVSDGLFDFADLFNTSLALAGAQDKIPTDRYIDGIDQTSFLVTDEGFSNRKYVYYWLQDILAALRVAEFKFVLAGMSDDDRDTVNPGSVTTLDSFKNAKLFNLYLDPKEQYNFWGRQTFMDHLFPGPIRAHRATYVKFPSKPPS